MRPPNIYDRFLKELLAFACRLRREGNLLLPSERDICKQFSVSRITVRKALAQLERDGLIWRDRKATRIHPFRKQRGRYVLSIAVKGRYRIEYFGVYRRLWDILNAKSREMLYEIELAPFDPEADSIEPYLESLKGADAIFVSLFKNEIVDAMRQADLPIIALDSFNTLPDMPQITLDNKAVGVLAARHFHAAGCRKPAILSPRDPYSFSPFRERRDGFSEWFQKRRIEPQILNTHNYGNDLRRYVYETAGMAAALPEQGFDSLFLLTDEWIDILLWELFLTPETVPDRLKIIAFDGSGQAIHHNPVITTVSNGSRNTAAEILNYIQRQETGKSDGGFPCCSVMPEIQPGETC